MPNIHPGLSVDSTRIDGAHIEVVRSKFSEYKYQFTITWYPQEKKALFVTLNPTTVQDSDETVGVCGSIAKALGFGVLRVCNLFACVAADSEKLKSAESPVGPENDRFIVESFQWADEIVAAWGDEGEYMQRHSEVEYLMDKCGKSINVLGFTYKGQPKHPLEVSLPQPLQVWKIGRS